MKFKEHVNQFMHSDVGCVVVAIGIAMLMTVAAMLVYPAYWFVVTGSVVLIIAGALLIALFVVFRVKGPVTGGE